MINFLKTLFSSARKTIENASRSPELEEWFLVRFDSDEITLQVSPPNREFWTAKIKWTQINRVCFNAGDLYNSDDIYLFTNERAEDYLIPTEANGASALWEELLKRNLFDAELAIQATTSTNKLFCCPPIEE